MDNTDPPKALVRAVRRLLEPLVRLLIAHGITYPLLSALLKNVYVEVARKHFRVGDKPLTDSRVSVLTGVHRKDVKRFREEPEAFEAPASVSLGAQIIGLWTGGAGYLDESGAPLPLPRSTTDGSPSFDGLVEQVSKDVRPRTLLDEWLRSGWVDVEGDRVILNTHAFVPREGFDDQVYFYGRNLHDHMAAGTHNLLGGTPTFLERAVFYGDLSEKSVSELEELARPAAMKAVQNLNRSALERKDKDQEAPGRKHRFSFGVYFYSESDEPEDDDPGDETPGDGRDR